jgi:hypothetical protein
MGKKEGVRVRAEQRTVDLLWKGGYGEISCAMRSVGEPLLIHSPLAPLHYRS